jgi:voltage-gated sodium channel
MARSRDFGLGQMDETCDADCFRTSASDLELGENNDVAEPAQSGDPRSARIVTFSGPSSSNEKPRLLGRPENATVSFDSCRSSGTFTKKVVVTKEDSDSQGSSPRKHGVMKNLMMRVRSSGARRMSMTSMPTMAHTATDAGRGPPHRFPRLARLVRSREFEAVIGVVIIVNCVTMGLEVETLIGRAGFYNPAMVFMDNFFAVVFLIELIMRVLVFGWRSYVPGLATEKCGSVWNLLEAIVVLISCVTAWMIDQDSENTPVLQALTILRALRLVRVVRVVSRVKIFHEVWLLLRGLTGSMRVLFWTVVVIFFITYMFAVFGVVLISVKIKTAYDAEVIRTQGAVPDYSAFANCGTAVDTALNFRSTQNSLDQLKMLHESTLGIWQWMFTLLQVLTLDSWMSIARPMQTYVPWSWAFFYLYIAIAVFVLMNLVTAIIVENALKSSQKDADEVLAAKDLEKKKALKKCKRLFNDIDEDKNGELTLEEFTGAFKNPLLRKQLEVLDIHEEDSKEVFKVMDTGDGVLQLDEFFEGITRMQGPAQAKDMFRVLQITQKLANDIKVDLYGSSSAQLPSYAQLPQDASSSQATLSRGASGASRSSRRAAPRHGVNDDLLRKLELVCSSVEACDRKLSRLAGTTAESQAASSSSLPTEMCGLTQVDCHRVMQNLRI